MSANLQNKYLYRMTHIQNIAHILQYGITHFNSKNKNPNYRSIGDNSLIGLRNQKELPNHKRLGDYIPFYLGARMPMLYVIQNGFNNVPITPPEEIIYCILNIQNIITQNLDFLFTDGHATSFITTIYTANRINEIDNLLDFEAINAKFWADELDKKRRKEAEFLILNDIDPAHLLGFAVYNAAAKTALENSGVPAHKIGIRPDFYF